MLNCTGFDEKECANCLHNLSERIIQQNVSNVSLLTVVMTLPKVWRRRARMNIQLRGWSCLAVEKTEAAIVFASKNKRKCE